MGFEICRSGKEPKKLTVKLCSYGLTHPPSEAPILGNVSYTETITIACKFCGSQNVVKYGKKHGTQYYLCRDCHRTL